jgi:hypothetical protein
LVQLSPHYRDKKHAVPTQVADQRFEIVRQLLVRQKGRKHPLAAGRLRSSPGSRPEPSCASAIAFAIVSGFLA